jgi:hypothetical protein
MKNKVYATGDTHGAWGTKKLLVPDFSDGVELNKDRVQDNQPTNEELEKLNKYLDKNKL